MNNLSAWLGEKLAELAEGGRKGGHCSQGVAASCLCNLMTTLPLLDYALLSTH